MKNKINTDLAPSAIGTYSQAISVSDGLTVYLSGQIPLLPSNMEMISDNIDDQIKQVFGNLKAVCKASGVSLQMKLTNPNTLSCHYQMDLRRNESLALKLLALGHSFDGENAFE